MNLGKSKFITGQHLRDSIEAHKLYIGYPGSLFTNNFSPLSKFTPTSWITNTWKFLWEKNMVVEGKKNWSPMSQIHLYNWRIQQKSNSGGRAIRTGYMLNIPESYMPIRTCHRIREINFPYVLDWKDYPHEPPIQMATTTESTKNGL